MLTQASIINKHLSLSSPLPFQIPIGVSEEERGELLPSSGSGGVSSAGQPAGGEPSLRAAEEAPSQFQSFLSTDNASATRNYVARFWRGLDRHYLKPTLTHSVPTLLETMPGPCHGIARCFTSQEQMVFRDRGPGVVKAEDEEESLGGQGSSYQALPPTTEDPLCAED